jgi:cytochrome c oxidase assembly protein subunit 15
MLGPSQTSSDAPASATSPTPQRRLRSWAMAALVTNIGIVVTGGLVRVTASGLGCSSWPECEPGSVLPRAGAEPGWHQLIEFGNRTLTGVVLLAVVGVLFAARRATPAGSRPRRLAALLVAGVLSQALLGGVTVLLELHPLIVAAHFLLSMALIAAAMLLVRAVGPHDAAATPVARVTDSDRARITVLGRVLRAGGALILLLGTVVTAAGPHAGDPGTPRLPLSIRAVARTHSVSVWVTVSVTVVLLVLARRVGARMLARAVTLVLVLEIAQGGVGYWQYHTGVPARLVLLHMLLACLFWASVVRAAAIAAETAASPPPDAVPTVAAAVDPAQ